MVGRGLLAAAAPVVDTLVATDVDMRTALEACRWYAVRPQQVRRGIAPDNCRMLTGSIDPDWSCVELRHPHEMVEAFGCTVVSNTLHPPIAPGREIDLD